MFISFEGIEGSGKSTLLENLKKYYLKKELEVIFTKEPGGTELGKDIRGILLNPESSFSSEAELLLLMADRIEHVTTIINPNLKKNKIIFCDRYIDSTIAYQGKGRNLSENKIKELIDILNLPIPDLTILLDLPVEDGLLRANKRNELDRFEKEDINFHKSIRKSYLDLQKKDPKRIFLFDSSISENKLFENVLNLIEKKIHESH
ncbi:MAG: dTMP kinase [Gammaproteobacteria bacterium]|tara:strand:- start:389 stop:1003 length:615 start_codon:yes stop_codon:yes gene_type:complete